MPDLGRAKYCRIFLVYKIIICHFDENLSPIRIVAIRHNKEIENTFKDANITTKVLDPLISSL